MVRKKSRGFEDLERQIGDLDKFDKIGLSFFVNITFLVILICILLILSYILYLNLPGEPQTIYFTVDGENITLSRNGNFTEATQFYPNMKFNHNAISYMLDPTCTEDEIKGMINAFNVLSDNVSQLDFYSVSENGDIEVICSEDKPKVLKEDHFIAGEGGAKEIISTGKYNVINSGIILFYENNKMRTLDCEYPNVELHELMHVFGFNHTDNPNSLMSPYLLSCDQVLDDSIIRDLKRLYSQKNLPDLHFRDIQAIKSGRYFNFNVSIRNSGVIGADSVNLTIFDNGELSESHLVGDLKYGAGIFLEIKNMKLRSRGSNNIDLIIDYENEIKELNETNNQISLVFD